MPKRPLEWSPRSQRNVESIRDYIAADNPTAAARVVAELIKTVEDLPSFPLLGHTGRRTGTRELVLTRYPYTIIYRLTPKKIAIVAVLHQSRHTS